MLIVTCVFFLCVFAVFDLIKALCYKGRVLLNDGLAEFICQVDIAGECDVAVKATIKDIKV